MSRRPPLPGFRSEPSGPAPVRVHVAGLSSRSHLVYAASYVRHLLGRTSGPVEVVARPSGGFRGTNPLTAGDVGRAFPEDPLLSYVHPGTPRRPGSRTVLLSVGVPGIKPYLGLLRGERRPAWVVVCDEGIGTYGDFGTRLAALRREGTRTPRASLVAGARTTADVVLTDQRWNLYVRDRSAHDGWRVEQEVAGEFLRHVSRSGTPRRAAVYLTQPWVELDLVTEASYLAHLEAVERACSASGLKLEVRPHPVEDPGRYAGLPLITGQAPAELDHRVVDASVVLGGASTALLNLAAVHGVPAIRVSLRETDKLDAAMNSRQASLFAAFVPQRSSASDLAPLLARALNR